MSSFIKGNKIWNRIEKKILISEGQELETGLCGAFTLDSTVRFLLDMKISADSAKMIFISDADGKRQEFDMISDCDGNFFAEIPMRSICEKSDNK